MQSGIQHVFCRGIVLLLVFADTTSGLVEDRPDARKPVAAKADKPLPSRPRVAITISRETTCITQPLRKDGYVDYVAALNERCRQGVTPENNASVLFWKAVGPGMIRESDRKQFFAMLGIPPLPEKGGYFVPLDKYPKGRQDAGKVPPGQPGEKAQDVTAEQLAQAMKRPWSKSEFPVLAGWLAANQGPLALVVEASKRPRRYDPMISSGKAPMIAVLLPGSQQSRDVVRALAARAMFRLGGSDVDGAWEDLLSCHRLARLVGQGPTLIDVLVANAIDGITAYADRGLLQHARLTAVQANKMRDDLGRLSSLPPAVEKIDVSERFMYLDCVAMVARDGLASLGTLTDGGEASGGIKTLLNAAGRVAIDWDHVLRTGNSWYGRLVTACRKPSRAERKQALGEIDEDVRKQVQAAKDMKSLAFSMLANPRQAISRRFGQIFVGLFLPAISCIVNSEDRAAMQFTLIRLGFSLAAYRADHGSYPAKLADLVPKYVAQVPMDIFNAGELRYWPENGGYLLYSVGVNGKDDGGKGYEDRKGNEDWDDLAVRTVASTMQSKKR